MAPARNPPRRCSRVGDATRRLPPGRPAYSASDDPNYELAVMARALAKEADIPDFSSCRHVVAATAPQFGMYLTAQFDGGTFRPGLEFVSGVPHVNAFDNRVKTIRTAMHRLFRRASVVDAFRLTEEVSAVRRVIRGTRRGDDAMVMEALGDLTSLGWRPMIAQLAVRAVLMATAIDAYRAAAKALRIGQAKKKKPGQRKAFP